MQLSEPLRPVLAILQRTYPNGVSEQDYPAMLVVLGDLLSERSLARVVAEFTDDEMGAVANDAAAVYSVNRPKKQDVTRVRAALEAHGLAELYEEP